ncbi:MAG: hypothetical protein WAZ12_00630 [Candidatus Absconditicoccaceae bacterium]
MLNNRKSYGFDFDSNLVFTQDTIFLLKRNGKSWHQTEVSQQEFDQISVDNINWRRINDNPADSLINFLKPGNYKKALLYALDNNQTGPGRGSFLEANESASPITIITARGQSPKELKESHKDVIYSILNLCERERLVESMQNRLRVKLQKDSAIELYLNNNLYLPVESQEFLQKFNINTDVPVKIRKNIAFEAFVSHVHSLFGQYYGEKFINNPVFSMGFSDDNLQNSQAMVNFIKSDLLSKYPHVKFVVYDTNDVTNVKRFKIR